MSCVATDVIANVLCHSRHTGGARAVVGGATPRGWMVSTNRRDAKEVDGLHEPPRAITVLGGIERGGE